MIWDMETIGQVGRSFSETKVMDEILWQFGYAPGQRIDSHQNPPTETARHLLTMLGRQMFPYLERVCQAHGVVVDIDDTRLLSAPSEDTGFALAHTVRLFWEPRRNRQGAILGGPHDGMTLELPPQLYRHPIPDTLVLANPVSKYDLLAIESDATRPYSLEAFSRTAYRVTGWWDSARMWVYTPERNR